MGPGSEDLSIALKKLAVSVSLFHQRVDLIHFE
jgi:hypothetical protein